MKEWCLPVLSLIMSEIVTYNKSNPNVETQARRALEPVLLARGQVLFIACFLVTICAIAIPVPESFSWLLDAGWLTGTCRRGRLPKRHERVRCGSVNGQVR